MINEPKIPLPNPMLSLEPDSWAYRAVTVRFATYVRQILEDNRLPEQVVARLRHLIAELPQAPIRCLEDSDAPDVTDWNSYIEMYVGMNWLEPPWFFSEHYFYRRIIEAIGYFQDGVTAKLDPFERSKQQGLEHGLPSILEMAACLEGWLKSGHPEGETLLSLLYLDLWGNQADYSLWPADAEGADKPDHVDASQANDFLLIDSSPIVVDRLLAMRGKRARVDFMIDNAGLELVSDLVFADYLLSSGLIDQVDFHLKAHPTFVSDAVPKDVESTLAYLKSTEAPAVVALGERLEGHLQQNRLKLRSDFFWNSPLDGWKMPKELSEGLGQSNLVISKGDANYRRLLGDRHWPFITPFSDIVSYFPAPLVALRTLKSELACGLAPGQAEPIAAQDPDWLVNGRWGVIQIHASR